MSHDQAWYGFYDHDQVNGIPFVYALLLDGGIFNLLVDTCRFGEEDIAAATHRLRTDRDVVSLKVVKLKPYKAPEAQG